MSKYTTQLRWVIEQAENDAHGTYEPGVYTEASYKKIGLSNYPIFDEKYRTQLNNKIIDHFYFREIGMETVANFAWFLRRKMNEIMSYYNQLYESVDLVTDPVNEINVDYTLGEEEHISGTSDNTSNSSTNSEDTSVYSDTPMDFIENGLSAIKNGNYATNATYDTGLTDSNTQANTESEQDRTRNEKRNEKGHRQSQSDLLLKYRETFINIDMMIIEELETLFMGVW